MYFDTPIFADFLLIKGSKTKFKIKLSLSQIKSVFSSFERIGGSQLNIKNDEFDSIDINKILEVGKGRNFEIMLESNLKSLDNNKIDIIEQFEVENIYLKLDENSCISKENKKILKQLVKKDISFIIIYLINNYNFNYLLEAMEQLQKIGVKNLLIRKSAHLQLDSKNWQEVIIKMTNLKKVGLLPIDLKFVETNLGVKPIEVYLPLKKIGLGNDLQYWVTRKEFNGLNEKREIIIDNFGNVFSHVESFAGNVSQYSLEEIWLNSKIFKLIRRNSLSSLEIEKTSW